MGRKFDEIRSWVAETLWHAVGNPREEKLTNPPAIGPQPYRDVPAHRR